MSNEKYERILNTFFIQMSLALESAMTELRTLRGESPPPVILDQVDEIAELEQEFAIETKEANVPRIAFSQYERDGGGGGKVTLVRKASTHREDPHDKNWADQLRFIEILNETRYDDSGRKLPKRTIARATADYVMETAEARFGNKEGAVEWGKKIVPMIEVGAKRVIDLSDIGLRMLRIEVDKLPKGTPVVEKEKQEEEKPINKSKPIVVEEPLDRQIHALYPDFIEIGADDDFSVILGRYGYQDTSSSFVKARTLEELKTRLGQLGQA